MIQSGSRFSFEDLEVWKKAVAYARAVFELVEMIAAERKHYRLLDQLEGSAASVASNIAEGKGRYSKKEFVQFLYVARGSLYVSITQLIILHRNGAIADDDLDRMKCLGTEIGKMLSSLISSIRKST